MRDWRPHPGPQTLALSLKCFEILYGGARGGGKTDAGLAWLAKEIANPKYRFLVIRRNADDLSDWIDRARTFYARMGAQIVGKPVEIRFPSGAMGRVGHLKDENAYSKYQGHEYHRMLIEELTQIPREEYYLKLLSSCRSTVPGLKPRVFATTNPGGVGHVWVKKRFINHGDGIEYMDPVSNLRRVFISAKLEDNPTLMANDPNYANYLRSLPDKLRKAWLEGNWDVSEGQFFDEWDTLNHVVQPFDIPKAWNRYIGLDYGYAAPSAVLWFAVDPHGVTYQYREMYRAGLTFESLRDEILRISEGEKIEHGIVDPALRSRVQGTGEVGLETLNSQDKISFIAGDNNRINGWGRLRDYYRVRKDAVGRPYAWLKIFATCENTINSIPYLMHDAIKVEDLDTDGDDHCADAQRYFVMSRPTPTVIPKEDKYQQMRPQDAAFWKRMNRIKKSNTFQEVDY